MTNKAKALIYTLLSCLAYTVVMAALLIWKWDDFVKEKSTRIGISGFIIIGLILICFKSKIFKLIEGSNILFTFSLIGFLCCFGVKILTEQLMLIFAFSLLGSALSSIFDRVVNVYKENSYKVIDGIKEPNTAAALPDREAWRRAFGINYKAVEDNGKVEG